MQKIINPIIFFDQSLMPTYKSVSLMLERGDVVEPDYLLDQKRGEELSFNSKSNAFLYLKKLASERVDGYAIIRVRNKKQAKFLDHHIKKRIRGKHVYIKHWNQTEPIDPRSYFTDKCDGVLTVVIVQKKAAMGNSISTEHLRFVYDYSPRAALSTIVQGLLGRCCGHGKIDHSVKVFTHVKHAEAYSLFEQGRMLEFAHFLKTEGIKPSGRSTITRSFAPILSGQIQINHSIESREEARLLVEKELKKKLGTNLHINGTIATRFLNAQKNPEMRMRYERQIEKGINPTAVQGLEKIPGKTELFYDHRSGVIYYGYRLDGQDQYSVIPKETSIYTQL